MNKTLLLLVFAVFSCLKSFAQPANDDCSNAIVVACGATETGTTDLATIDAAPVCGPSLSITAPGVWYSFAGTGDSITASLCGSAFDTQIFVYSGTCGSLTCVVGNDDAGAACPSNGLNSITNFNSTAGTNYYILVTGYGTNTGAYSLNIGCVASPVTPINDNCANATIIACGGTATGSTTTATVDVAPSCGPSLSITAPGVWYSFAGTGDAITASLCGSSFDTQIFVYSGSCGSLTCVDGNDDVGATCPSSGLNSIVYFNSTLGTNYYILVTGFGTSTGAYSLNIGCAAPAVPPANDDCTGILPTTLINGAAPVTFTGTTMYATYDTAFSTIVVWEAVTLTECSDLQIDYCGTNPSVMQSAMIVYTACPVAGLTSGTWDITTCTDGNVTVRFFNLPAGTYYLPVYGGSPNTPGPYIMNAQSFDCNNIGIEEAATTKNTLLYPNPAADVLNIKGVFGKETIVTIIDALGKVLLTGDFNSAIDITFLENGVYIVQIQGENYNHYERFVKAK